MTKVYTTGYSGKKHSDLLPRLERLDAVLVDIRLVPYSRWQPHWNKARLQTHLGERYVHVRELGNEKFKEGGMQIADMEGGLRIVGEMAKTRSVVLMCGCLDARFCHRRVVAEELSKHGFAVAEISDWRKG